MQKTIADIGLFSGIPQLDNFANFKNLVPVSRMAPSSTPRVWPQGEQIALPETYRFNGEDLSVEGLLRDTSTSALIVLRDGKVRYEGYWHTGGPDVQWISMSVAKSFVSAMVGMLVDDGAIGDIDEPISDYVRVEPGSAYDGVSIRNTLLMSSGARWNEDYSSQESDVRGLNQAMRGIGGDLDEFIARMSPEHAPGSLCRYNSGETQVLGALIRSASGKSVSEFMHERLMEPLGFERDGYWWVDTSGVEAAFGGLNLTARDFARLGELYRLGGVWDGSRLLSEEWVRDSTTVTAPQCAPERLALPGQEAAWGYGYQWWLPVNDHGAYTAIGVYNQFVFVDPVTNTTIVKLSANERYGTSATEEGNLEDENIAFLLTLAALEF